MTVGTCPICGLADRLYTAPGGELDCYTCLATLKLIQLMRWTGWSDADIVRAGRGEAPYGTGG